MRVNLKDEVVSVKEGKISIVRNDEEFITKEQLKQQVDAFNIELSKCSQEHQRIKERYNNFKKAKEKALEMVAMIEAEEVEVVDEVPETLE